MYKNFTRFIKIGMIAAVSAPLLFLNVSCLKPQVAVIGVIAPLDGGLVEFGRGIRNSVQLAIDEANETCGITGLRFELKALDDSSDPDTGAAAAEILAATPCVIGVVGTYNSGVAAEVAPILNAAGIPMISPGNTNPVLTLGDDWANPVRPYDNYFRVVASDAEQGPYLAHYAFYDMQIRNVAVVSESKPVSKALADAFSRAFQDLGGTILTTEDLEAGTTDYEPVMARVAGFNPELVFFGGEYEVGAAVRLQAVASGISAPMMGGDGLKAPAYIDATGTISEGDVASTVGAPAESLPSAQPFIAAYEAAAFAEPASDFGPYAYDAANVLIAAAKEKLHVGHPLNAWVRQAILNAVQATDTSGATGPISFDAFGDTTNAVLTMYKVVNGVWVAQ